MGYKLQALQPYSSATFLRSCLITMMQKSQHHMATEETIHCGMQSWLCLDHFHDTKDKACMLHALVAPAWKGVPNGSKSVMDMCQCRMLQACRHDIALVAQDIRIENTDFILFMTKSVLFLCCDHLGCCCSPYRLHHPIVTVTGCVGHDKTDGAGPC